MFSSVSTSGTSPIIVQLGAGSVDAASYVATGTTSTNAGAVQSSTFTTGFPIQSAISAASVTQSGIMVITLLGSNLWCSSFAGCTSHPAGTLGGGSKTTSGTLDRVRITTVGGTDTFDAGSINILYE
jgi:hypothetical protein